ncbi:MAG: hypothetical protein JXR80_04985 [Deltaproteobacteria bacterium]|nr:hypothetical protein [Deltaproteobacteria bacterium]
MNKKSQNQNLSTGPGTSMDQEPHIHIRITADGEICAWGLDRKGEERIFSLTGNQDLINKCKAMSYNLCG